MNNPVLMSFDEPTDKQLSDLMHEVAQEAKQKAMTAQKALAKIVEQEIINAQSKLNDKQ